MKKIKIKKLLASVLVVVVISALTACGNSTSGDTSPSPLPSSSISDTLPNGDISSADVNASSSQGTTVEQLYVQFGDDGEPFTMYLYDNKTAAAIAHHVGTADWRIPLYNYEGYENWEVMQYYDIPSQYEIPSNAETITDEVAGTVYYSEPNRIVLFYGDAQVSGEYTPVGYFEATQEFLNAVQDNPVLEGWGNKIIQISIKE